MDSFKTQKNQESQNSENEAANASITYGDIMYCDTPLSQIQSNQVSIERCGESQSVSSRFNIPSRPNDIVLSSVDINGIANRVTQNQIQSLSVSLAQQSVNRAYLSTSLNIPEDITDHRHKFNKPLNNHASNDCESPSDSDNIATRVKAKYSKARQKKIQIHEEEITFTTRPVKKRKTQTRNLDILSPFESLSIEY